MCFSAPGKTDWGGGRVDCVKRSGKRGTTSNTCKSIADRYTGWWWSWSERNVIPASLPPFSSWGFVRVNETDAQLYVLAEENCEKERECVGGKARVAFHIVDSPASCTAEYMVEQKRESRRARVCWRKLENWWKTRSQFVADVTVCENVLRIHLTTTSTGCWQNRGKWGRWGRDSFKVN